MGSVSNRRAAIVQDIRGAFASVSLDGGISLPEGRLLDDQYHPSPAQLAAAREAWNARHHWSEVPYDVLDEMADAITFLDARGRQYYLPAFMIVALDPPEHDSGNVEDCLIHTLVNVDRYRGEFDSYTEAQKTAIAHYLQYMMEDKDAIRPTDGYIEKWAGGCDNGAMENGVEVAYTEYWSRFAPRAG